MQKIETQHKVLFTVISIFCLVMFADDFIRGVKNFPERFVSALEISRACDNGRSECQFKTRNN